MHRFDYNRVLRNFFLRDGILVFLGYAQGNPIDSKKIMSKSFNFQGASPFLGQFTQKNLNLLRC